jgi:hypothetical protein
MKASSVSLTVVVGDTAVESLPLAVCPDDELYFSIKSGGEIWGGPASVLSAATFFF